MRKKKTINIKNQDIILSKLEKINLELIKIQEQQEELLQKYTLLSKQKEATENFYKIVPQLLLKDLLGTYKSEISNILNSENDEEK